MTNTYKQSPLALAQKTGFLPPWIWFWLVLYFIDLPTRFDRLKADVLKITANQTTISFVERTTSIAEIVPLLAIFAGVLVTFLPWIRTFQLTARYNIQRIEKLSPEMTLPETRRSLEEIQQFFSIHAPNVLLTYAIGFTGGAFASPLTSRYRIIMQRGWEWLTGYYTVPLPDNAIAYPHGYRQTAIAVSPQLLRMWREKRSEAEEILLHEFGHCRHGDRFIIGTGSLLETVSRNWLWITLVFTLVPLLTALIIQDSITFQENWPLTRIDPQLRYTIILSFIQSIFVADMQAFFQALSLSLFWSATQFVTLLAAIWCAELSADRFVVDTTGKISTLTSNDHVQRQKHWWKWLFELMTHPPRKLRTWIVTHTDKIGSIFLLLFFPFSFIVLSLLKIGLVLTAFGYQFLFPLGDVLQPLLQSLLTVLLATVVLIFCWPFLNNYWERLFSRIRGEVNGASYSIYAISAVVIICFGALSILAFAGLTSLPQTPLPGGTNTRPIPTIPTDNALIPMLAHAYKGTMTTAANQVKINTTIQLSLVQQGQQGMLQGSMTISGQSTENGTFTGQIDSNKVIRFTFTSNNKSAHTTINFSGTVGKDSSLVGIYIKDGTQVGTWQLSPA